ncbi:universal stress protein [Brachybacterium sp. DNPG3]
MTIVVGYSPSGQGKAALRAAVRDARRTHQDVVVASHQYFDAEAGGPAVADEAAVREALAELGEEGLEDLDITVRDGEGQDIGDFLLALAEELSARLLVIGLRWKSPIGKLNLGASARRVVMGAPCPVLAVKEPEAAKPAPASRGWA